MKNVTLADIARLAGVSSATVSRALRDSPLISEETKARVRAVAKTHNYRPNLVARNLRLKQSQTVALVLSVTARSDYLADPFLAKFIGAVGSALRAQGYDLLITQASESEPDIGARYLDSGRADGLVFLGRTTFDDRLVARMAEDAPIVVWGPQLAEQSYCSVGIDNVHWSRTAVAHLLDLGRRRVAFLGGDAFCMEMSHRYQGYEAALQVAGIAVDPALIANASWDSHTGYEAMQQLLAAAPDLDAVFANSDVLAIAALEALRAGGRRVPQDVAVVGFDNIAIGAFTSPPLTTVSQNLREGAPLLVEKLLRLIANETAAPATIPGKLIVRQSSGARLGEG